MEFKTDVLLHGGDYNPDQWLDRPDILEKDAEMLAESGCNVVSLGIFAWSTLEPEEGVFHLDWMEEIIDRLYEKGIRTILATPSGARPKWLADKYPEVLRVDQARRRHLFGLRQNHCYTSPIYREKVRIINRKLAERFGNHPAVILWHLSNEYGGECHCPLCQAAFREWLKERYQTIENLNRRWCTTFWSHTYRSFEEIESPSEIGETDLHALNLDWKRFVTHQTRDFMRLEIQAVREGGSRLPVTANLMYYFDGLDYFKLARDLDVVSWDTYPKWGKKEDLSVARDNAMCHDLMRSLKRKPFFQMESSPSATNWQEVSKLKRPGILWAQSMQAIAHGGEGALYFQIRQSQGASEKFHGAVIDHYGGTDTRVFQEVSEVGDTLKAISEVAGSRVESQVALLYDWSSNWAMEDSQGPRNSGLHHHEALLKMYGGFRKLGLNVDLVDEDCGLEPYKVLAVSMGYLFQEGFAEKVRDFVEKGGTLIVTYWSGIVDDTDRCYLDGVPYGLMDVLGLRSEEIDGLYDWEENHLIPAGGNELGLTKSYSCRFLCDLVRVKDAEPLMVYGDDFYAGHAALTQNRYGKGKACYIAADAEEAFYDDFIAALMEKNGIISPVKGAIPAGLEVTTRETAKVRYYFYQNFSKHPVKLPLPEGTYETVFGNTETELKPLGMVILREEK